MSKTSRRTKRLRWLCPECGGSLLIDAQSLAGEHLRCCIHCKDEDGFPVLAQSVVVIDQQGPMTRTARLSGIKVSRFRTTRNR